MLLKPNKKLAEVAFNISKHVKSNAQCYVIFYYILASKLDIVNTKAIKLKIKLKTRFFFFHRWVKYSIKAGLRTWWINQKIKIINM